PTAPRRMVIPTDRFCLPGRTSRARGPMMMPAIRPPIRVQRASPIGILLVGPLSAVYRLDKQDRGRVSVHYGILDPEGDVQRHREHGGSARGVDLSAHFDDPEALDVVDGGGRTGEHGLDGVLDGPVGL